jgi:acyl-CoA thioesterase FadM
VRVLNAHWLNNERSAVAKVELNFPQPVLFTEALVLRTTDLSRAGHLGFDKLVSLLHHVMDRFFDHCGLSPRSGQEASIIAKDLAVIYEGEAHAGDRLSVAVGLGDRAERWVELYFRVRRMGRPGEDEQPVALAKMAILSFDYERGRAVPFPEAVRKAFENGGH